MSTFLELLLIINLIIFLFNNLVKLKEISYYLIQVHGGSNFNYFSFNNTIIFLILVN